MRGNNVQSKQKFPSDNTVNNQSRKGTSTRWLYLKSLGSSKEYIWWCLALFNFWIISKNNMMHQWKIVHHVYVFSIQNAACENCKAHNQMSTYGTSSDLFSLSEKVSNSLKDEEWELQYIGSILQYRSEKNKIK